MRFLLESSPVYHIFQVEPSLSTDGSAALKLSAEPAGAVLEHRQRQPAVARYLIQ